MRVVRCRYLRRNAEQCTAPAVDPDGDCLLCAKHLTRAFGHLESVRVALYGPEHAAQIKREAEQRAVELQIRETCGLVYYAEAWGHIKIGTTTSIGQRMVDIRATRVLATEPGSYALEAERHRQFAHLRAVGEYFHPAPELIAHTEAIRAEHGKPITSTDEQLSLAEGRLRRGSGDRVDAAGLGAARLADAIRPRRSPLRAG